MPDLHAHRYDTPVAVIGDIHGRSDLLDRLLTKIPAGRPVLVAGDVGDRGPDTAGVIARLIGRGAVGVRGNHEEWLLEWLGGASIDPFALTGKMGGRATLASYGIRSGDPAEIDRQRHLIPEAHAAWLRGLALVVDLEVCGRKWWLIHAGVPSTVPLTGLRLEQVVPHLAAHHPEALLWAKNDPEEMLPVDRPVIMGHVPLEAPYRGGGVLAIDTGSGRGGGLTAVLLPEERFVTVA